MNSAYLRVFGTVVLLFAMTACNRSPEARRDRYINSGKDFLQKRDYPRAILAFKNAASAMPKDAEAYYQMGLAFSAIKDYRSAVGAFRKATELDPKHAQAQLRLSQILAMTDDPELLKDAQERIKSIMAGSAATAEELNTLALTDLRLGNMPGAMRSLEQAVTEFPSELSSAVMMARTKLSQKDPKGAEEVLKKLCSTAPKSADARRLLGEFYVDQQRMPEAAEQFRQAVQLDPKSGPALMDLARLQLTAGQKQEAEQSFRKLAAFDGYSSVYAVYLYQEGRLDEAIREFERLASASPDDRQARTRLVAAYRGANRPADAEKVLDKALKENPKDTEALLQKAEVLVEKGSYADAENDLNRVLKLKPTAPEVHYVLAKLYLAKGAGLRYQQELDEALRLNPALAAVRVELGQYLVNHNQGQAALDMLNAAPASQKSSIPMLVQRNWALWQLGDMAGMRKGIDEGLSRVRTPDLLIQDGLWKLKANNPAGARTSIEEALKIDPSDIRALRALNQTYSGPRETAAAVQKVKEYAARQPNSAAVQDFLGLTLLASGDRKEARAALNQAHAADPHFTQVDLTLAQLDAAEGRLDDARNRLRQVLTTSNGNLTAERWLGNLEEYKGNHTAAIDHFRKVLQADPDDAQASNNLAYLLTEYTNQADDAVKYAQKAVELAPQNPAYCDTLGWALYRKGLYGASIPYLERAGASTRDVVWKYHLAMAYAKAGDVQKGRTMLEVALKQNPAAPEAKMARDIVGTAR